MSSGSLRLSYDATRPLASGSLARAANGNGWYNQPVALNVTGSDATSGVGSCVGATYGGPDGASRQVSGSCTDTAGNSSLPATVSLNYDATPPTNMAGSPARSPDANGWYNQPIALSVTGTDATSGIASGSCGGPSYSGPDGSARTISGSCTDRAGNTSNAVTATIKYDGTAPTASGSLARGPDLNGWYNQPVAFALTGTDATSGIASCGGNYAGPDGVGAAGFRDLHRCGWECQCSGDGDDQVRRDAAVGVGVVGASCEWEWVVQPAGRAECDRVGCDFWGRLLCGCDLWGS